MGEEPQSSSQNSQSSTFSDLWAGSSFPVDSQEITSSLQMEILQNLSEAPMTSRQLSTSTNVSNVTNGYHNDNNGMQNGQIIAYAHNQGYGTTSVSNGLPQQPFVPTTYCEVQQSNCAYQIQSSFQHGSSPGSMSGTTGSTHSPYTPTMENPQTPPSQVTNGNLPCLSDYTGDYGFKVSFGERTESAQKSAQFTHSHILEKLYVKMNCLHPVMIKTEKPVPDNTLLRAMPVFKAPDNVSEVVSRCPNHKEKDFQAMDNYRSHLIRVENSFAHYAKTGQGRESVVIPFPSPEVGSEFSTVLFKYMCLSSCVGGINRRAISTIFTIEHNGNVIGRQCVEVRICSCPGRDRSQDEKRKRSPTNMLIPLPKKKKKYGNSSKEEPADEGEYFFLPIKGRTMYNMLKDIKDGMELKNVVDQKALEEFRAHRATEEENALRRHMVTKFFKEQEKQPEMKPFLPKNGH